MFTDLTNTRNSNLYLVIALAITLVVILTFALAPSIAALKSALIPVTGSQNVYVEFLRGEKAMYANPVGLSSALSAYHLGEKNLAANPEAALLEYRQGEKDSNEVVDTTIRDVCSPYLPPQRSHVNMTHPEIQGGSFVFLNSSIYYGNITLRFAD